LNRSRGLMVLRAVRTAGDPARARTLIADAINPYVASLLGPAVFDNVREDLLRAPEPPARPSLTSNDVRGAVGVFLLVFLSTFPVVIPFLLIGDAMTALRASNAVAVAMLCAGGYSLGLYAGMRPWLVALAMAVLGTLLVAITIALGG
jgi:VIT1/CCC1 family predicted Fe2+/Mn2+ transporter